MERGDRWVFEAKTMASTTLEGMNYEKWDRITEPIMSVLSFVFLAVYSWMVLAAPYGALARFGNVVMDAIWFVFAVDYIVSLILVPDKAKWFVSHIFDLLVVLLPMFRPLRLIFALTPLRALRKASSQAFRVRVIIYAVAVSIMVFYVGSLALFDAERNAPASTISTYPEALWCTWVSATAVGYGDYSPVTPAGRIIASTLMFAGIILNGIICALLSSWLIQEESIRKNREDRLTKERIAKIHGHMDDISKSLKAIEKQLAEHNNITVGDEGDDDGDSSDDDEDEEESEEAEYAEEAQKLSHGVIDDKPDSVSGYTQIASVAASVVQAAASASNAKPLMHDPKADRLTGEKRPASFRAIRDHYDHRNNPRDHE